MMGDAAQNSPDSSPLSWYTSKEDSIETPKSTTASTSTPAHDHVCAYRAVRELPRELKEHCQIFLEEQLYLGAIALLNSILGAGISSRKAGQKPVPIPPPSHLGLLNTITIHPLHTTRAEKPEHLDVSSLALAYLRNVLAVAGPVNADFRTAFQFIAAPRWNRRLARHGSCDSDSEMTDGGSDADSSPLRGRMANESSVWVKGQDFWLTAGWAFNCCTLMPHRWRYWKAWLEFMVDVLEADWAERERLDKDAQSTNGDGQEESFTYRRECIMYMYMEQQGGRQSGVKGIMKTLFAYGGSVSSSAFQEVFEKEHKGPPQPSNKRKREALDLANNKFGDYFEDESISSGISEPPTPQKKRTKETAPGSLSQGMLESIPLRLRLFRLLSAVVHALQKRDLDRLYDEFAAGIKVLPLDLFSVFVTQRPNPLILESHVTITKELFHLLLPSSYKDPRKVDPEGDSVGSLTMPILQKCYVCHPANTIGVEENAKLSLLVESAIQLLWICEMLTYSDEFEAAVEKGIEARLAKAQKKRGARGKSEAGDVHGLAIMNASSERIRLLLSVLRSTREDTEGEQTE